MAGRREDSSATDGNSVIVEGAEFGPGLPKDDVKKLQIGLLLSFVARNLFWKVYENRKDLWQDWDEDPLWKIEESYQTAMDLVNALVPPRPFEDYSKFELMGLLRKGTEDEVDYAVVQLMNRLRKGVANDIDALAPEERDLVRSIAIQDGANKVFSMLKD